MRTMRFLRSFILIFVLIGSCSGEPPDYYKTVNRVVWIVQNIDHAKQGWVGLGLSDVHEYPDTKLTGQYRGKSTTINARRMTGRLGNLTIDMIQPAKGQQNAFIDFLKRHGDGIFSIVHAVPSREVSAKEISRMGSLGVAVLQQVTLTTDGRPLTFTYFDTEPRGKFVLGMVCCSENISTPKEPEMVSHLAPVIRESESVSAYWQHLGFPAFRMNTPLPEKIPDIATSHSGSPLKPAIKTTIS
jgi:Glyoxalase/Bleomycin resistance protein/Dioxygenase superfamily